MSFPVRLNCVFLRTLLTFPLLLTMLSAEMLLDARQISEGPGGVVVDAALFRAYVNLFLDLIFVGSLLQLPWEVMPSSVELQVLVPLETFVADFTDEPVCRHQGLWR